MQRLTRFVRRHLLTKSLQTLARELPLLALLPLALAVFSLFALIGPIVDVLNGGRQSPEIVLRNALFSGAVAIGYAFGSMRRKWVLVVVTAAIHILWISVLRGERGEALTVSPEEIRRHLRIDAISVLVLMVISYTCFLWFINGTATRYLRVRAEMDLAHQIHQVLVPVVDVRLGDFAFFGLSKPSGEVGGDLVDVVREGDGWFGYVADVSGHGVSSGVVMGMFKSALRMRLLHRGAISELLADLNAVLFPLKSGAMYVTAACLRGGTSGTLEFAVAGHLPILRVRAGSGLVDEITTPQIPIGMFAAYPFTSASLDCNRGDLLALITDGLTEVFDAEDRELGMDPIKRLLADSAALPLPQIADRLLTAARAHGAQLDDQTLLLIRRG